MGHTVCPMRQAIYAKLDELNRLASALREPKKSIAEALICDVYKSISAIAYLNPLPKDIEKNIIYSILIEEKASRASRIENLTLLILSIMVRWKGR